jgi:NAD(P)-dependent dehydrogenase (short-subunit alcohol dehydrogenase family)
LITGTDARRPGGDSSVAAILAASLPAIAANIAVELAPMRANVIAAGYVDTPLSARILGDELEHRRAELQATLPIRRVVGPADVAALAVHLMTNTAVTGATFDVDGGQQLIP